MKMNIRTTLGAFALSTSALGLSAGAALADIVHLDDVIIDGSLCVGFDCVNGEAFGFDTIRLKENNLRIKALDTSSSASFPTNDWQITFNETSNGGANKFSIDDIDGGRTPFTIEAGAPSNSLYVDDGGRIGVGTATPVVEMHVVNGDSPTLRLEQNGSSGFTPQTWDVAGNETNFFVRDVTNGSRLPLRIFPNAPSSALTIEGTTGDVGIGVGTNPTTPLHVKRTDGTARILVEEASATSAARGLLELKNAGATFLTLNDTGGASWNIQSNNTELRMASAAVAGAEFALTETGNLTISGTITTSGSCSVGCDAVFSDDYQLPSISEHASAMWQNRYLPSVGPTAESGRYELTSKVLGMLNELEHAHIYIEQLHTEIGALKTRLDQIEDDRG